MNEVKNNKLVYGIGDRCGLPTRDKNGNKIKTYSIWCEMLRRCYSEKEKFNPKNKSYQDCSISDDWLKYKNFHEWYEANYYQVDNQIMAVDKDILEKGNRIYCAEKCILVPSNINILFAKNKSKRGDCPIGVTYHKRDNIYEAKCCIGVGGKDNRIYLGRFTTPEAAFQSYKTYKEKLIKQIADSYKDKIPLQLHEALYRYEVEITD